MNKRAIIKIIIFVLLTSVFSLGVLMSNKDIITKGFRFINSALLSYLLVYIFSNITTIRINKDIVSKKAAIISLLWAVTFIIANVLEYKTILKVLNLLALFVIGTTVYELFNKKYNKENTEINVFEFGYVWIGFVLLIPIILILVIIGF